LIGWEKAGPPKKHFCFDHVNRLNKNKLFIMNNLRIKNIKSAKKHKKHSKKTRAKKKNVLFTSLS